MDEEQLRIEHARYREALENILDPVSYLMRGLQPGYQIDGEFAVKWAEDQNVLKHFAKEALHGDEEGVFWPPDDGGNHG